MDRDLFAIFPDLPWPRIGHPRIRRLERLPKPPLFGSRNRRTARESLQEALQRISIIAQNERKQVGAASPRGRALAEIIMLASAALSSRDPSTDPALRWSTASRNTGTPGARVLVRNQTRR
jgi:hypothetical protein